MNNKTVRIISGPYTFQLSEYGMCIGVYGESGEPGVDDALEKIEQLVECAVANRFTNVITNVRITPSTEDHQSESIIFKF
ncbi:MAG: hypothetical protein RLZZ230_730 [Candidatus Parcubacteria bacterium]